jgi:ankyrin repeat protein
VVGAHSVGAYLPSTNYSTKRGADMSAQNKDGSTPLRLATIYEQMEVPRMLIERGVDVPAQTKYGSTPLHWASRVEIAGLLIARGSDVTPQNEDRETPLRLGK